LACFALTLVFVASLNYFVDPLGLYDSGRRATAAAVQLAAGRDLVAKDIADRGIQLAYTEVAKKTPDVLVIGSSRIMEIDSSAAPERKLYNAGVSTLTLPDLLGIIDSYVEAKKLPPVIVIGIDTWLFNHVPVNDRWRALSSQYKRMLARLGVKDDAGYSGIPSKLFNLVSLNYTLASAAKVLAEGRSTFYRTYAPDFELADKNTKVAVKSSDGSLKYGEKMRSRTVSDVRVYAIEYARKHMTAILKGGWLAPQEIDVFTRLVRFLKSQGTSVVLLMPPYHPLHYAYVREHDGEDSLSKTEATIREIGRETGATVAGSYDPAKAHCSEAEFWDGMHARKSCLTRLLEPALATVSSAHKS